MNKNIKKIIGAVVLFLSFYLFVYLKYKDTTFILVYHRISDYQGGLRSLYVKPGVFEKQMKYLYSRGYCAVSIDELKERLEKNLSIKKIFCITFDDGYEDLLNSYQILKKYNFKATVYVHTKAIQEGYYTYPGMSTAKMISVDQLKNILDIFEVGSHTVSHPDLTQVSELDFIKELKDSKKFLEESLNVRIKHFCYPFGKVPKKYKEALKSESYETATTLKNGLIYKNKEIDFYLLPRIEWKELKNMSLKDFFKNIDFYLKIFFGV